MSVLRPLATTEKVAAEVCQPVAGYGCLDLTLNLFWSV